MSDGFLRVSKNRPCPVCKKPDWCLVAADGSAAICPRVPSSRYLEDSGFLHKLTESHKHVPRVQFQKPDFNLDAHGIMRGYQDAMGESDYASLSKDLGVTIDSLMALATGKADQYLEGTYAFPMRNENDEVIGVRLRNRDGHKWSVFGSKTGLFYGAIEADRIVFICEGPTDTAALISLGQVAIGKPSCSGGNDMLTAMIRRIMPPLVVVVADVDPRSGHCDFCDKQFCHHCRPGQFGAERTAHAMHALGLSVKIIEPVGAKDIRQWLKQGGTKQGLKNLVDNALLWTLA